MTKIEQAVEMFLAADKAWKSAMAYSRKAAFIDCTRRDGALACVMADKSQDMIVAADALVKGWGEWSRNHLSTDELIEALTIGHTRNMAA